MPCYSAIYFILGYILLNCEEYCFSQLPRIIKPSNYYLLLRPDIDSETFSGEVTITITVQNYDTQILLNALELNVYKIFIDSEETGKLRQFKDPYSVDVYTLEHCWTPGEHTIHMFFNGSLVGPDEEGLRKLQYQVGNETRYIVASDFEPYAARKAFPCWDDPYFKATFQVRLISPNSSYVALSNMPQINKFKTSDGIVYDFATSVPMSTYLVSFAIADYTYYEKVYEDNGRKIPIRLYYYNAESEKNDFPLNISKKSLEYYSYYTGISYPLPKLDLIEYNKSYSLATENWGLITFSQGILSKSFDIFSESQISMVVSHELAHFWFGNLVTNDDWNDIWLQEGFATYMAARAVANMTGESVGVSLLNDLLEEAYQLDTISSTKPVAYRCKTVNETRKHFNDITYQKGAIIVRMIETSIGEDNFREVIRTFLTKHAYKTATTNDLITIIEKIRPDINTREFLRSFLYQNRYPIVSVVRDTETSYSLTQMTCEIINSSTTEFGYKWTIPITYVTNLEPELQLVWFDRTMDKLVVDVPPGVKWIKFNVVNSGFYRMNYSQEMWDVIITNFNELSLGDRKHILNEAGHLYEMGIINCDIPIKLMNKTTCKNFDILLDNSIRFVFYMSDSLENVDSNAIKIFKKYFYTKCKKKNNSTDTTNTDNETSISSTESPQHSTENITDRTKIENNAIFKSNINVQTNNDVHVRIRRNGDEEDIMSEQSDKQAERKKYVRCAKWINENLSHSQ